MFQGDPANIKDILFQFGFPKYEIFLLDEMLQLPVVVVVVAKIYYLAYVVL